MKSFELAASSPLVVGATYSSGHKYAQDVLGLARGSYRLVTTPGQLRLPRGVVYLEPGWDKRRVDRHSLRSALRWTRMTVVEGSPKVLSGVEGGSAPEVEDPPVGAAALLGRMIAERQYGFRRRVVLGVGQDPSAFGVSRPAGASEPQRRRRRCRKGCGILVDPDLVEEHAASCEGLV